MKLFNKLLAFFLPVSLFYLFAFWLCIYLITTNYVEQKLQKDFRAMASLHTNTINMWVANSKEQLASFNSRLLVRKILAAHPDGNIPNEKLKQLDNIINTTTSLVGSFDEIYLLDMNGRVQSSSVSDFRGKILQDFQPMETGRNHSYLARAAKDASGQEQLQHSVELALDGQIVGYLMVRTDAIYLRNLLQNNKGLGESGTLTILRENDDARLEPVFESSTKVVDINDPMFAEHAGSRWLELTNQNDELVFAYLKDVGFSNWKLLLTISKNEAYEVIGQIRLFGIASATLAGCLMILNIIYVSRILSSPIEELAHHASHHNEQDESEIFEKSGIAEYDKLATKLNKLMDDIHHEKHNLERNVKNRTQDLADKNKQLHKAMSELKSAQKMLIETEKMAVLGEMVAGVAHEVNTPIGSALGAATHLQDTARSVHTAYEKGELTEDDFETLIATNQLSTDIVVNNLQRAGNLIRSFKRVAVDQSNEKMLEFDLVEYIKDVVLSLGPRYKHMRLTFNYPGEQGMKVRQIPGIIAQIISNLVVNAIVHGFENKSEGNIDVNICELDDEQVQLRVFDNGNGMTDETLEKVFDPFYTTRRGSGGTGLGLNIVHNLVVKNLNGQITAQSELNAGSSFILTFPRFQKGVQI